MPQQNILILGADGYCGWATSLYLSHHNYNVALLDNLARRQWDKTLNVSPLTPIATLPQRIEAWHEHSQKQLKFYPVDLLDYDKVLSVITEFQPNAIVHFAEQRSAPYSMISQRHATFTQHNNVIGTLNLLYAIKEAAPHCHLIKLGTMGEYGTPNIDIEEGYLEIHHNGRSDRMLYPKKPGSFYHLSKVHDSHNIEFACRTWDIAATDLNQGVVYGCDNTFPINDERLINRLDYDQIFGTALNRFCIQAAIGHPITVYGSGQQTRGFIDIRDTVRCIQLAIDNPANAGEFRVFNQFTESFSMNRLAQLVQNAAQQIGIQTTIEHLANPRVEADTHYYNAKNTSLLDLGLTPHYLSENLINTLLTYAQRYANRVDINTINPTVSWRQTHNAITATDPVPA